MNSAKRNLWGGAELDITAIFLRVLYITSVELMLFESHLIEYEGEV